jgi:3-oxoacyl-[acyl-carrier-protein] synthase-3
MLQIVRNVKIIGTGSYVPEKVYTNKYLESLVDTKDKWVYETLGIKERHIASENESTSDLASKAALNAIENAGLTPDDIDLIIIATTTPDRIAPSTACIVQEKIKAFNAAAFDLAAVCSGFLYSMSVASQFISANTYDNVLIVGADTFSKITDWTRRDCVFFGDGAGAAVLTHAKDPEGFIATKLYADGRGKLAWTIPAGGSEQPASHESIDKRLHYYQMNGKYVYDTAVTVLPHAIQEVLKTANIDISEVDYIIPHQPSIGILKDTARILGIPFSKVLTNMDKYANTSGGTIPILLDEANRGGLLKKDNVIVFAAVGSGWTWGAIAMRWV